MSTLLANQARIIAEGAHRVIRNDERLEDHTNARFRLTALDNTSPSELEAIKLRTLLVERYDETYCPSTGALREGGQTIVREGLSVNPASFISRNISVRVDSDGFPFEFLLVDCTSDAVLHPAMLAGYRGAIQEHDLFISLPFFHATKHHVVYGVKKHLRIVRI